MSARRAALLTSGPWPAGALDFVTTWVRDHAKRRGCFRHDSRDRLKCVSVRLASIDRSTCTARRPKHARIQAPAGPHPPPRRLAASPPPVPQRRDAGAAGAGAGGGGTPQRADRRDGRAPGRVGARAAGPGRAGGERPSSSGAQRSSASLSPTSVARAAPACSIDCLGPPRRLPAAPRTAHNAQEPTLHLPPATTPSAPSDRHSAAPPRRRARVRGQGQGEPPAPRRSGVGIDGATVFTPGRPTVAPVIV